MDAVTQSVDPTSHTAFADKTVDADGFQIRYLEAGSGMPLVCVHGAGGLRLSPTHHLLAKTCRVVAFEIPGFGQSAENERSQSMTELAATMNIAISRIGLESYGLMGTSFGGKLAIRMALATPHNLGALFLISPAAIRAEHGIIESGARPTPEMLYMNPAKHADGHEVPEAFARKQQRLVKRLMGPPREPELEEGMKELDLPVLAMFGTRDSITPPELGRIYREILPNCHLMMIYDAAHAPDFDRPEAVASVVGDFLERKDGFIVTRESGLIHP
jgi:pimeloyl-ACP methyl ester carboxylesterase